MDALCRISSHAVKGLGPPFSGFSRTLRQRLRFHRCAKIESIAFPFFIADALAGKTPQPAWDCLFGRIGRAHRFLLFSSPPFRSLGCVDSESGSIVSFPPELFLISWESFDYRGVCFRRRTSESAFQPPSPVFLSQETLSRTLRGESPTCLGV